MIFIVYRPLEILKLCGLVSASKVLVYQLRNLLRMFPYADNQISARDRSISWTDILPGSCFSNPVSLQVSLPLRAIAWASTFGSSNVEPVRLAGPA